MTPMQPRGMRRAWRQDIARRKNRPRRETEKVSAGASEEKGTPVETETKSEGVAWDFVRIRQNDLAPQWRAVEVFRGGHVRDRIDVTPDELQAIVQAAYDQYSILATPDMGREAARVAEAMPGLCRCGLPDCSDGDTALRAFADRWGQSLRGRS